MAEVADEIFAKDRARLDERGRIFAPSETPA
jgi:hypothetical protein